MALYSTKSVLHCVPNAPGPLIATGIWRGVVLDTPRGDGGFGYDPLFFDSESGMSAAELPVARKNAFSHRGRAAELLRELLAVEFG